ncbi:acyl carrier protein [Spirosoma flavum]|uniref:Acyl carrier protein n=1 Tax=Spirosoma flavum TaxID=2048557 RepID=A0ABW6AJU3_9BACT
MEITYQRLTRLVLAQGIVRSSALQPTADLRQDLAYRPSDIAELVILAERELKLTIPAEDYHRFTTLYESSKYIKEKLQEPG